MGRLGASTTQGEIMSGPAIHEFYVEARRFPPPPSFVEQALVRDRSLWDEAAAGDEAFWARQARELLTWNHDFHTTLEWDLPFAKWFIGGTLNVSVGTLNLTGTLNVPTGTLNLSGNNFTRSASSQITPSSTGVSKVERDIAQLSAGSLMRKSFP
jgi:hypothetical protein